jgi:repressor LexA
MTFGLTRRQNDLLRYLKQRACDPVAPSFNEMADAIGLKSRGGVQRLVYGLEERGYIRRIPGKNRSISLTEVA